MIDYEDKWCLLGVKGSVVPKASLLALPTLCISIFLSFLDEIAPHLRKDTGIDDITESQLWNAMTAVIAIMLGFRTKQALGRFWEGTGLLHQMRGEWFDAASCLMAFSRDAKIYKNKAAEVKEFRHTLMRLMSLMHGSALDEISGSDDDRYEVLDIHGLDQKTLRFLRDCKEKLGFNRVEALQHMIQVLVTHNHHAGVITIPPPILSRIYQTLSRGLVNLLNARKIKDTSFPFPYAQVIWLLLVVHSVITPLLMTQVIGGKIWAALFSFFPILGMITLNIIAAELEMPFGNDENDLPLRNFQSEMNDALLMLIHDFADHLPHTSRQAKYSYELLQNFARASVIKRANISPSDSQSFMRKDFFFFDVNLEEGEPEKKMSISNTSEHDSQLSTFPIDRTVEERQSVESKTIVASGPPLQPENAVPPKLSLPSLPEAAGPVLREPVTEKAEIVLSQPSSVHQSDAEVERWASQMNQNDVEVVEAAYTPSTNMGGAHCCSIARSTPRSEQSGPGESSWKRYAQEQTPLDHKDISNACKSLVRLIEVQVKELKYNTEMLRAVNNSYPDALRHHCEAMKGFTDTVSRAMNKLAPPPAPPVQSSPRLVVSLDHDASFPPVPPAQSSPRFVVSRPGPGGVVSYDM